MKYFVAHLLSGEVAQYHHKLTRELSERFRTVPIHEKVAPHITVKIPFEANDYEIAQVAERLALFTEQHQSEPLLFEGFGRFGFKTAYVDVVKSHRSVQLVRSCVADLNQFSWMQQVHHEGNKLHASVARFMKYKQFRRVWRYLKTEQPHFKERLDSLAILKKEPGQKAWSVHKEFALKLPEEQVAQHAFAVPAVSS